RRPRLRRHYRPRLRQKVPAGDAVMLVPSALAGSKPAPGESAADDSFRRFGTRFGPANGSHIAPMLKKHSRRTFVRNASLSSFAIVASGVHSPLRAAPAPTPGMKITSLKARQPPTPGSPPDWRTQLGQIIVEVQTDSGLTGIGVGG